MCSKLTCNNVQCDMDHHNEKLFILHTTETILQGIFQNPEITVKKEHVRYCGNAAQTLNMSDSLSPTAKVKFHL